jgi:hypothetical protein
MFLMTGILVCTQPRVEWGQVTPFDDDGADVQSIRLAGGEYVSIERAPAGISGKHATARLFDASGRKLKESKVEFKSQSTAFLKMRPELERLVEVGGRHYFLVKEINTKSLLDSKSVTIRLQSWAFDPVTLTVAAQPVTLASVKYVDPLFSSYLWTISPKDDFFYVLESPGKEKTQAAQLTLKAYDPDLKLLYERNFMLPPAIENLAVNAFKVKHGHLVVSSREYEKRPPILGKNMPDFKLLYFILPQGEEHLQIVPIELPGVRAYDARHIMEGSDALLCYGFYSKSKADSSSGAFFVRYDLKKKQLTAPQLRAFPADIVESADHRKRGFKDRNGDEVSDFKLYDISFRPDGGLQFIAEQSNHYWLSSTFNNFDGSIEITASGTQFEFDDIMVFTLYDDPSRDWFSLIRKRQSAVGTDRDFSFTHTYDKDGTVWILYNDLPENLALPSSKEPANLKAGRDRMGTVLARIDSRGRVSKELLFTKREVGYWFAPRQTVYSPDGSVLLTAFSKKGYRTGRLVLGQ